MNRVKLFGALAALLTGCATPKKEAPEPAFVPDKPGTSIMLSYPIMLLETEPSNVRYFDNEEDFTTTKRSSNLTYTEQRIIDSGGGLFSVQKALPVGKVVSGWRDMGTTPYRVYLVMKREKTVTFEQAKKMVLDVLGGPRSNWNDSPEILAKSVAHVEEYRTLPELIAGAETPWKWWR